MGDMVKRFDANYEEQKKVYKLIQSVAMDGLTSINVYGPYSKEEMETVKDTVVSHIKQQLKTSIQLMKDLLLTDSKERLLEIKKLRGCKDDILELCNGYSINIGFDKQLLLELPSLFPVNLVLQAFEITTLIEDFLHRARRLVKSDQDTILASVYLVFSKPERDIVRSVATTRMIELTEEDIVDIMSSALEGGIGYWATISEVERLDDLDPDMGLDEVIAKGGKIRICDAESREDLGWFDIDDLEVGLNLYYSGIGHELKTVSIDDIDAEHADVIFQLGLLGEVVYG